MQLNEIMGLDPIKLTKKDKPKKRKAKKSKPRLTHDDLKDKSTEALSGMLSNIKN